MQNFTEKSFSMPRPAFKSWQFFDPRPAFEQANTLLKSGAGDIVWVNVTTDQDFQEDTLVSGWNLIVLK